MKQRTLVVLGLLVALAGVCGCEGGATALEPTDAQTSSDADRRSDAILILDLAVVLGPASCAAFSPAPTNEIPWSHGFGAGRPGAWIAGTDAIVAVLARNSYGALALPFAFVSSIPPFVCFSARGTLTIAGLEPISFAMGQLYHDTEGVPIWLPIPLGAALETIDLEGRAFALDITLQGVSPDYSTNTFSGTIDDPRR